MFKKKILVCLAYLSILNLSAQTISYSWLEKINLAKEMLRPVALEHSDKNVTYVKKIKIPKARGRSKSARFKHKSIVVTRKYTDYAWKEVALAVMDTDNGNLETIKIRKIGQKLLNDSSRINVSIENRPSGLAWNGKNTAFFITNQNPIYAVIANKWLEHLPDGTAKEHVYSPFSTRLNQKELIEAGDKHLDDDIDWAMVQLAGWGVGSLAFPNTKISEIVPRGYLKNIVLNEHTDPQEFYAFKDGLLEYDPFERVKVIIGANDETAYTATVSSARAIGLTQFTEATWNSMIKKYTHVKLPDFKNGAANHTNSLQATALLYDYNLGRLIGMFGKGIADDSKLESYLAAAHNCGIERVIRALKKPGRDWRQNLRKLGKTDETIIYLEKLDYLLKNQSC